MQKSDLKNLEQQIIKKLEYIKKDIDKLNDKDNKKTKRSSLNKLNQLLSYFYEIRQFYYDDTNYNFMSLINEYYHLILNIASNYFNNKEITNFVEYLDNNLDILINESENIKLMNQISNVHNNIVIVGPNGSGKSSLVNYLATSSLNKITALPAQKLLFFNKEDKDKDEINIDLFRKYTNSTVFNLFKDKGKRYGNIMTGLQDTPLKTFTLLVSLLYKEHDTAAIEYFEGKSKNRNSLLMRLKQIWSEVLPDIKLITDSNNRSIEAYKNNNEYSINQLSDGEKSIIFYIGNVLFAEKNSYIIIDEPETFLNPSIYNRLWDILINERHDCQFIFTSHNTEFINARSHSQLVVCNGFTPPDKFDLKVIEENKNLPRNVISELLGSKKPIMFCEGTYYSCDYQVYSKLFTNHTIIPVNGHEQVINYTETINNNGNLFDLEACGIIDGDYWNEDYKNKYNHEKVIVLPYNEIEMLLLDKKLLEETINYDNHYDNSKVYKMLINFYNNFFEIFNKNKDLITSKVIKFELDHSLRNSVITKKVKSKININEGLNDIENIINKYKNNVDNNYDKQINKLQYIIKNRRYDLLLQYCCLKGQITKNLARKCFDINYEEKALSTINYNKEIRNHIIKNIKDNNTGILNI